MNLSIVIQPLKTKFGETHVIQAVDNLKFQFGEGTQQEYCQNPDWKEGVKEIMARYK